ncbi:MAG: hypothetical protein VKJ46_03925 [Leptolyngbyaceae bacterium]|nr:hypothetical protein [Leptolyngbyaceae bacterium]
MKILKLGSNVLANDLSNLKQVKGVPQRSRTFPVPLILALRQEWAIARY